mmetsp:Transcript_90868/g.266048  ORF Transcript_90868/g.266048 Transcript_90868/m.266048 type:complete len:678 (-) Transcript_90868:316-2349(-)
MAQTKVTPVNDVGKSLTPEQVRLRANKRFQYIVVTVTCFAVFIDILGTAISLPALAALCAYAEGGPVDTIMGMPFPGTTAEQEAARQAVIEENISPHAFQGERGAWSGAPPVRFSLAMNLVGSFGQLGSAAGSLVLGRLCDIIGCKIPMQLCLFMGIVGYLMIYAAGIWARSYYLFALGIFWNNFFGNTMGVAQVYFGQLFEGAERDLFVGSVLGMGMVGASVGALVVMPFVLNPVNGANYFDAIWLALGLTVFALILVTVVLVPPEKREKEVIEEKTPRLALRILTLTVIASAIDSAGDEGTRMARGTIMSALFPDWSTISRQNYLLIAMIGVAMVTGGVLAALRKCFNLGMIAVIGCVATLATQLLLMIDTLTAGPYIIIWHCGKLFGFLSTFCSSFIVQEVAPKKLLGYWNGRNEALTNLLSAITPLIFAAVYDGVGNVRGQEMLACTAVVSFFAVLAYIPIVGMLPKPAPKEKKEDEIQDLSVYETMTDTEYSQLPLEMVDKISMKFLEEGKAPRAVCWGDYQRERPLLSGLSERALKDFKYYSQSAMVMLTDRELMAKEQENYKKFMDQMPQVDREKAKAEMGAWIADYLDDAGYVGWETQCQMFKSMMLSAFPPIDALDDIKPDYATMSLDRWEESLTSFLAVMDSHLASEQRRIKPRFSAGSIINLLRRR